jgi:hypothetical protein
MRKDYQIFAVFALIIVIFIGYWTMSGTLRNSGSVKNNSSIVLENGSAVSNVPSIEFIQSSNTSSVQSGSSYTASAFNLTDQLSGNIASEFLSKVNFKKATSSQGLIDQINSASSLDIGKLTDQLQKNPLGLISSINESSLSIGNDNSLQVIQSYGQQWTTLFSQSANSFILNPDQAGKIFLDAVNNGNNQKLDQLISDFNTGYDKIIKLKVPSSLLLFHEKTLIFLKNSALVFEAIRNGQDDPIKAYVAVTDGATEITSESEELVVFSTSIAKKYNF